MAKVTVINLETKKLETHECVANERIRLPPGKYRFANDNAIPIGVTIEGYVLEALPREPSVKIPIKKPRKTELRRLKP